MNTTITTQDAVRAARWARCQAGAGKAVSE